ncbi:pentapeptide repeat-containing protein, partial [Candidatus Babeliales bacterium]|nr:pentapeptide repeat-containing protein [Candidatus Babeliales bacterium]
MKTTLLLGIFLFCFVNVFAEGEYENKIYFFGEKFSHRIFVTESFCYSTLSEVDFSLSRLNHCDFSFTQCEKTIFTDTCLYRTRFMYANCHKAKFNNSSLVNAWLWHGNYTGADFTNANLKDAAMFFCKIGTEGEDKTIVTGANFKNVWGLTNIQKKYLKEHGAINVPEDCDEEKEFEEFKAKLNKRIEEGFIFYPLNKWFRL